MCDRGLLLTTLSWTVGQEKAAATTTTAERYRWVEAPYSFSLCGSRMRSMPFCLPPQKGGALGNGVEDGCSPCDHSQFYLLRPHGGQGLLLLRRHGHEDGRLTRRREADGARG